MKALVLLLACASASSAMAADYVYDLSMPFYAGTVDNSGYIVTNCDHCVLDSADIVSWSMRQTNAAMGAAFGGATFTSSSMSHSSVVVQGAGLVATPTALSFDFKGGDPLADVRFTSGSNAVHYSNGAWGFGGLSGLMEDCSGAAGTCAGSTPNGVEKVGSRSAAPLAAPELSAAGVAPLVTLVMAVLALAANRRRPAPIRLVLKRRSPR